MANQAGGHNPADFSCMHRVPEERKERLAMDCPSGGNAPRGRVPHSQAARCALCGHLGERAACFRRIRKGVGHIHVLPDVLRRSGWLLPAAICFPNAIERRPRYRSGGALVQSRISFRPVHNFNSRVAHAALSKHLAVVQSRSGGVAGIAADGIWSDSASGRGPRTPRLHPGTGRRVSYRMAVPVAGPELSEISIARAGSAGPDSDAHDRESEQGLGGQCRLMGERGGQST